MDRFGQRTVPRCQDGNRCLVLTVSVMSFAGTGLPSPTAVSEGCDINARQPCLARTQHSASNSKPVSQSPVTSIITSACCVLRAAQR